ncbi:hypothetical protein GIB67_019424 [Kingdonia uniflora]|uniref:Uncharacterized protein n=1 Tax=Kingdonia uniflora TaxID=39325 RepID=A0A7J7L6Q4_9MAGN|nr:hypothetical protein GIB67_019424 [Kingdonia uniflora]
MKYAPSGNRTTERRVVVFCVFLKVVRSCFYRESLPNGSLSIQTCGMCPWGLGLLKRWRKQSEDQD